MPSRALRADQWEDRPVAPIRGSCPPGIGRETETPTGASDRMTLYYEQHCEREEGPAKEERGATTPSSS